MTNSIMEMVREFSEKTQQAPDDQLYASLIIEEYGGWLDTPFHTTEDLKELSDLVYVIYGYANAMNWDLDEAVRRVHQNNLDRVIQPDGTIKRREDGKILKRENPPKVVLEDLL